MKIGLVDVDRSGFPNYALMKISSFHKVNGDSVEWADPLFGKYDRIYKSKIFTFTEDDKDIYDCETICGGTGYDLKSELPPEIDMMPPDYSLYNIKGMSYGFLTRGCINKCPWCVVPIKEGKVRPYRDIEEVAGANRKVTLMDNNILASDYGISQLEKIRDMRLSVDFNQGLDARLITEDIAQILAGIRWIEYIRLACDSSSQIDSIIRAQELLSRKGYNRRIFVYFLIKDYEDAVKRLDALYGRKWFYPFGQPYRDFNNPNQLIPQWQKDMARWMNRKWIFKSCSYKDYVPRSEYKEIINLL